MKAIIIHGINTPDGGASGPDKLAESLRAKGIDVDTDSADYGYYPIWKFWQARTKRYEAIARIYTAIRGKDVIIAHSNGCLYTLMALQLLDPQFHHPKVIFLAPPVNSHAEIPECIDKLWVYYTPNDWLVRFSGWIYKAWGKMGQIGYQGHDPRVRNIRLANAIKGHSSFFESPIFLEFITLMFVEHLTSTQEQ